MLPLVTRPPVKYSGNYLKPFLQVPALSFNMDEFDDEDEESEDDAAVKKEEPEKLDDDQVEDESTVKRRRFGKLHNSHVS